MLGRGARRRWPRPNLQLDLHNIEADVAVDEMDEPAVVDGDIVALRRPASGPRLWHVPADLARRERVGHVDDAKPTAEPGREHDRAAHVLAKLVRAKAGLRRAGPRAVELAHVELPERHDAGRIGDIESHEARMWAP